MHRQSTLQPTTVQTLLGLQMANGRLHCGSAFKPTVLLLANKLLNLPISTLPKAILLSHYPVFLHVMKNILRAKSLGNLDATLTIRVT